MRLPGDHPSLGGGKYTSKLPHAKKPKARPPRGWRDKSYFPGRSMPTYTGPYPVATMEIEVPARNPRVFSHIRRDGRPLLQLETVLMTVYYPTVRANHRPRRDEAQISRQLWLGRPRVRIAQGYGRFAGVGGVAVPLFLPAMFTKLPAYRNGTLARYWAPAVDTKSQGIDVKTMAGDKPDGAADEPCFPFMLFSHGLGGTRTMYSSVCGEFASYGFVVCAVEHRDGSGPRTYINNPSGMKTAPDRRTSGQGANKHTHKGRGYRVVDYVFPKDNPYDTAPHSEKGVDSELRGAQIDLRLAELEEAYEVMKELHKGLGQGVADRNLRRKGFKGSSSHGLEGIDWTLWKESFQLQHVTACGHSFGAATVVEMLRHDDRFTYIGQGIIYDIWGAGTQPPEKDAPHHRVHAPILAINSEAFTYWSSNFDLVSNVIQEALDEPSPSPSWLMTVRGTVHISQSDFSLLYPHVSSIFLKMVANPQRALDLNINASLEFLSHILPAKLAQVNRAYKNENLLESATSPLERIPSTQIYRPKEKYTAMRLKIRHEWVYRLSPKLFRKFQRHKAEHEGRTPETGDEIWLHVKPTAESIEHFCARQPDGAEARKEKLEGALPLTCDDAQAPRDPDELDRRAGGGDETTPVNPNP